MFIGHYSVAFFIKAKAKQIPLWILFIAVQMIDIIWTFLVFIGLEKIEFRESNNVYLQIIYKFFPFSHSLFTTVLLSAGVFWFFKKYKDISWAWYLAIAVMSHWFLDLIVHVSDLPLLIGKYKLGFSLWDYPYASLRTEVILLGIGAAVYLWANDKDQKIKNRTTIFLVLVWLVYIFSFFASAIPPTKAQVLSANFILYTIITISAWWIEQGNGVQKS